MLETKESPFDVHATRALFAHHHPSVTPVLVLFIVRGKE